MNSNPRIQKDHERILVLGIGNDLRGDDAVGLASARAIADLGLPFVTVVESSGDGTSIMEAWSGFDAVFIIDAVSAETIPGSIFRIDLHHHRISPHLVTSTHNFGLAEVIELARVWDELPPTVLLYGVQISDVTQGAEISRRVSIAIPEVVRMIEQDVGALSSLSDSGTTITFHVS